MKAPEASRISLIMLPALLIQRPAQQAGGPHNPLALQLRAWVKCRQALLALGHRRGPVWWRRFCARRLFCGAALIEDSIQHPRSPRTAPAQHALPMSTVHEHGKTCCCHRLSEQGRSLTCR